MPKRIWNTETRKWDFFPTDFELYRKIEIREWRKNILNTLISGGVALEKRKIISLFPEFSRTKFDKEFGIMLKEGLLEPFKKEVCFDRSMPSSTRKKEYRRRVTVYKVTAKGLEFLELVNDDN